MLSKYKKNIQTRNLREFRKPENQSLWYATTQLLFNGGKQKTDIDALQTEINLSHKFHKCTAQVSKLQIL